MTPLPKNSLESAYRLVADIAELFLLNNIPLNQYNPDYPFPMPTPSKAEVQLSLESLNNPDGTAYKADPTNAVVVPQDLIDRLCNAIADLDEIEESYWDKESNDS